jgi:tetratricopeptide (TPR) repeat protein
LNPRNRDLAPTHVVLVQHPTQKKIIGSGCVVHRTSKSSLVLTCAHVVEDCAEAGALMVDGQDAEVLFQRNSNGIDIALLKVKEPLKTKILFTIATVDCIFDNNMLTEGHYLSADITPVATCAPVSVLQTVHIQDGSETCKAWKLQAAASQLIEPGFSGGPLFAFGKDELLGIILQEQANGKEGLGLAWDLIQFLPRLYRTKISHIPSRTNFLERRNQIAAFHKALSDTQGLVSILVTIDGMAGVGKSWLAAEMVEEATALLGKSNMTAVDFIEPHRLGLLNSVKDVQSLLATSLYEQAGFDFSGYHKACAEVEVPQPEGSQAANAARSKAWFEAFRTAVRASAPFVFLVDNYESVAFRPFSGGASPENFCHHWFLRLAREFENEGLILILAGRGIPHEDFQRNTPHYLHFRLTGLSKVAVKLLLQAAGVSRPTASLVNNVHRSTGGHPMSVNYLISALVRTGDPANFVLALPASEGADKIGILFPEEQQVLARILRYSWEKSFIPKERLAQAVIERAWFCASALIGGPMRSPAIAAKRNLHHEEFIDEVALRFGTQHGEAVTRLSSESIRQAYPSLFTGDCLDTNVEEMIFRLSNEGLVPEVSLRELAGLVKHVAPYPFDNLFEPEKLWDCIHEFDLALYSVIARWSLEDSQTLQFALRLLAFVLIARRSEFANFAFRLAQKHRRNTFDEFARLLLLVSSGSQPIYSLFSRSLNRMPANDKHVYELFILGLKLKTIRRNESTLAEAKSYSTESLFTIAKTGWHRPLVGSFVIERADRLFDLEECDAARTDYEAILADTLGFASGSDKRHAAHHLSRIAIADARWIEAERLLRQYPSAESSHLLSQIPTRREMWFKATLAEVSGDVRNGSFAESNLKHTHNNLLKLSSIEPQNEEVLLYLITVTRRLGLRDELSGHLKVLRDHPTFEPRSLIRAGEALLVLGNIAEAKGVFESARKRAISQLGTAHEYLLLKLIANATNHLGEVAAFEGDLELSSKLFEERIELAERLVRRSDGRERRHERSLVKHALTKRGFVEMLRRNRGVARECFERAIQLDGEYMHALLGNALVATERQELMLERCLEIATKHSKTSETAIWQLDSLYIAAVYLDHRDVGKFREVLGVLNDVGRLLLFALRLRCAEMFVPVKFEEYRKAVDEVLAEKPSWWKPVASENQM